MLTRALILALMFACFGFPPVDAKGVKAEAVIHIDIPVVLAYPFREASHFTDETFSSHNCVLI